ncbi:MAG: U-box domain-containing protein [Coxiellaceae bacterium]|nr:U-box domain-containing protein [Coxiellaceae bacterium]
MFFERKKEITDQAPAEFLCPITKKIIQDPVVAQDGYTYERAAIQEWFSKNDTSHVTKILLDSKMLFPNNILKQQIEAFMRKAAEKAAQKQLTLSDDMLTEALNVSSDSEKVAAVKKILFKEKFHVLLSQLQDVNQTSCTLNYNRANEGEEKLLRGIIASLKMCRGLEVRDAGAPPIGAADKFRVIDKAVNLIGAEKNSVIAMQFARSATNHDGNESRMELSLACRLLAARNVRFILVAVNCPNIDACFTAFLPTYTDKNAHAFYSTQCTSIQYTEFLAGLLQKIGYLTELGFVALLDQTRQLSMQIEADYTAEQILEALAEKQQTRRLTMGEI